MALCTSSKDDIKQTKTTPCVHWVKWCPRLQTLRTEKKFATSLVAVRRGQAHCHLRPWREFFFLLLLLSFFLILRGSINVNCNNNILFSMMNFTEEWTFSRYYNEGGISLKKIVAAAKKVGLPLHCTCDFTLDNHRNHLHNTDKDQSGLLRWGYPN
jgi:hypothetical protein